jgi:hypothetical protein
VVVVVVVPATSFPVLRPEVVTVAPVLLSFVTH